MSCGKCFVAVMAMNIALSSARSMFCSIVVFLQCGDLCVGCTLWSWQCFQCHSHLGK